MNYYIIHKTQNWIAAITYSQERAEKWLNEFNPKMWDDKTLTADDFIIVIK